MVQADRRVDRLGRADVMRAAGELGMAGANPTALTRLIGALCDERSGADELASRIEAHSALCARVLQLANSPFYGQVRAVATIKRALLLLGLNAIRGITAAACVDQLVPRTLATLPDISAVLRHSMATAIATETLATILHPMLTEDAFVAGVLHNFGIVLQASLDPTGVAAMIAARRTDPHRNIRNLESSYCSIGHEDCAATLFDGWQLPDSLVATALHHHEPRKAPDEHRLLVTLVGAGAELALLCANTFLLEPNPPFCDQGPLKQLDLDDQTLQGILAGLPTRIDNFTRAFC